MTKIQVRLNPDVQPTGSDLAVVNAARRSFNTRSEVFTEKDKRLIEFLARGMTADDFEGYVNEIESLGDCIYAANEVGEYEEERLVQKQLIKKLWEWRNTPTHDTPFNHCFISFEVKAPIFVARQLVKHEYLIMSEFSRRYITNDIEFYEPDYWRRVAPSKKQGSLEEPVDFVTWDDIITNSEVGGTVQSVVNDYQRSSKELYEALVNCQVAPEQARSVLPQNTMTEWTWSGTLGAFAKMCRLRLHPEAQYEARLVAQEVYKYLQEYYPESSKALVEGTDID